ncbi:MAG TPA: hypothetical protein VEQ63_12125 [Bryobacteraceae bacterium]|nr:hypothetical protein [Bryobacteraceae bacterium]
MSSRLRYRDPCRALIEAAARKQRRANLRPITVLTIKNAWLLACTLATACLPLAAFEGPPQVRLENARVFPFFATGGGWQSTVTLLNLFEENIDYRLSFRGTNGQPVPVTFRGRDGRITSADNIQGRLEDDASHTYVLMDVGTLQSGWATLEYSGESRIAGLLTFRQRVQGRPDFESTVLLARDDENRVYIPFDNTEGFATTVAITNPSTNDTTELRVRFWDASGSELLTRDYRLSAGTTVAFSLPQQIPELNGRAGQFRIEGTGSRLATLALRFNPSGAFSTVPVVSR